MEFKAWIQLLVSHRAVKAAPVEKNVEEVTYLQARYLQKVNVSSRAVKGQGGNTIVFSYREMTSLLLAQRLLQLFHSARYLALSTDSGYG